MNEKEAREARKRARAEEEFAKRPELREAIRCEKCGEADPLSPRVSIAVPGKSNRLKGEQHTYCQKCLTSRTRGVCHKCGDLLEECRKGVQWCSACKPKGKKGEPFPGGHTLDEVVPREEDDYEVSRERVPPFAEESINEPPAPHPERPDDDE